MLSETFCGAGEDQALTGATPQKPKTGWAIEWDERSRRIPLIWINNLVTDTQMLEVIFKHFSTTFLLSGTDGLSYKIQLLSFQIISSCWIIIHKLFNLLFKSIETLSFLYNIKKKKKS